MYRKAEKILQTWKANPKKKALLITGQRQAGKGEDTVGSH